MFYIQIVLFEIIYFEGRRNREICDVFGDAAMMNAYNISHSVQDFLNYRGFPWGGHKK